METSVLISLLTCAFALGTMIAGIVGYYIGYLINRAKLPAPRRVAILKDLLIEVSRQIAEVHKSTHEKTMQFQECTIEVAFEAESQTDLKSKSEIPQVYVVELGGSSKETHSNKITLKYQPIANQPAPQAPAIPVNSAENVPPGWTIQPPDTSKKE